MSSTNRCSWNSHDSTGSVPGHIGLIILLYTKQKSLLQARKKISKVTIRRLAKSFSTANETINYFSIVFPNSTCFTPKVLLPLQILPSEAQAFGSLFPVTLWLLCLPPEPGGWSRNPLISSSIWICRVLISSDSIYFLLKILSSLVISALTSSSIAIMICSPPWCLRLSLVLCSFCSLALAETKISHFRNSELSIEAIYLCRNSRERIILICRLMMASPSS